MKRQLIFHQHGNPNFLMKRTNFNGWNKIFSQIKQHVAVINPLTALILVIFPSQPHHLFKPPFKCPVDRPACVLRPCVDN